ncbi:conserved hypothetical protein [Ricinus communis]|uniref:At1g61320/AtMIF1 LRR domain-containing protein n=1 Tax=Ricinus communis TaxID=3988 RepID=B9R8Z1_RICCO|nr:conserved hypothetical protein [Ricinus communis]
MEKRVQILDLDFLDYFTPTRPYPFHADFDNKYRFPRKLINANGPSSLKQFSSSMRPCELSGFFPQLQVLRLEILQLLVELDHYDFPELTNLKHLEISVSLHPNDSLLVLTPLIEASPCLERFVLLLEARERVERHCYKHLKEVKLVGYNGPRGFNFIMHFIKHAPLLEKLTVDLRNLAYRLPYEDIEESQEEKEARIHAYQKFKRKVPSGVELVIL